MQGLGSGAIALFGGEDLQRRYLPEVATAAASPRSRSPSGRPDPTSLRWRLRARRDGDGYVLDGEKTWISNAGIADLYVVFARDERGGAKGISRIRRRCGDAGLERDRANRNDVAAPTRDVVRFSQACGFRLGTASARKATVSKSRWRRSTSFAARSARRRSASRAGRWTSRSRTSSRAGSSARRSPRCS